MQCDLLLKMTSFLSSMHSTLTSFLILTHPSIGTNKKKSAKSKDSAPSVPRTGQLVGYQIRFDSSTVGVDTKIKFMTDGILLKEVAQDLLLRKYRVVILDEAHERNINTDVLLGTFIIMSCVINLNGDWVSSTFKCALLPLEIVFVHFLSIS